MTKKFNQLFFNQKGFSLIEFLIIIIITSILFLTVVPNFREMELSMDRGRSIRQLDADIRKIQGMALSRGLRTIMSFNPNSSSYLLGLDYAPYSNIGEPDEILGRFELSTNISILIDGPIIFDSRGYLISTDGNLTELEFSLLQNGAMFLSGYIPPNGFIHFNAREV